MFVQFEYKYNVYSVFLSWKMLYPMNFLLYSKCIHWECSYIWLYFDFIYRWCCILIQCMIELFDNCILLHIECIFLACNQSLISCIDCIKNTAIMYKWLQLIQFFIKTVNINTTIMWEQIQMIQCFYQNCIDTAWQQINTTKFEFDCMCLIQWKLYINYK